MSFFLTKNLLCVILWCIILSYFVKDFNNLTLGNDVFWDTTTLLSSIYNSLENPYKIKLKESLGISDNNFVVGICARLEKYKGHKTFINAALLAKQDGENIKFIIMGDGSQKEALMAYSRDLNLDNTVIFTGFVDKLK